MTMPACALPIHGFFEVYLYLMVTRCEACDAGPLLHDRANVHHDPAQKILTVPVTCKSCSQHSTFHFDTGEIDPADCELQFLSGQGHQAGSVPTINSTEEPSRIIDIAGWLTLFSMFTDAAFVAEAHAHNAHTRGEVRQLRIQAGQCLGEALKFYEPDNMLPPPEAFFGAHAGRLFRDRPELFSHQRIIELHAKLPLPLDQRIER